MATARYLKQELQAAGIEGVDEMDSASKRDRADVIQQFAPYYNDRTSAKLAADGREGNPHPASPRMSFRKA